MNLQRAMKVSAVFPRSVRGHGRGLLRGAHFALSLASVLVWAGWLGAQDCAASACRDDPLFKRTRDPAVISEQVRQALPSAELGLKLLTSGDRTQLPRAIEAIGDTYRYLRAAQESSADLERWSKFPDPLAEMKMSRMWAIRKHTLACTGQAGHIINENQEMINMCAEHMTEGIRQLRVLLGIMP